jgi:HAE1 family hydrophobic/amphiphilic exporter-1
MLCSRFLKVEVKRGKVYQFFDRGYERIETRYRSALTFCLGHRLLVVLIAAGSFVGSIGILMNLKREFVPHADESRFMIRIEAPTGSTLQYTDEKMKKVENVVLAFRLSCLFAMGRRKRQNKGLLMVS